MPFLAEADDGRLIGLISYRPDRDWARSSPCTPRSNGAGMVGDYGIPLRDEIALDLRL
jgi:hypothetical protein